MEPELLIRLAACNLNSAYCIGRTCSETPKYTVPCLQLSFYFVFLYSWYSKEQKKVYEWSQPQGTSGTQKS